jgi:hypothetical protein
MIFFHKEQQEPQKNIHEEPKRGNRENPWRKKTSKTKQKQRTMQKQDEPKRGRNTLRNLRKHEDP